ncbi:hypothetical protein KO465_01260 [Candidatus Micrarchaeota archaeon]|nr:hypothetical protein [Candidatus Micrarchaeota archaeon]
MTHKQEEKRDERIDTVMINSFNLKYGVSSDFGKRFDDALKNGKKDNYSGAIEIMKSEIKKAQEGGDTHRVAQLLTVCNETAMWLETKGGYAAAADFLHIRADNTLHEEWKPDRYTQVAAMYEKAADDAKEGFLKGYGQRDVWLNMERENRIKAMDMYFDLGNYTAFERAVRNTQHHNEEQVYNFLMINIWGTKMNLPGTMARLNEEESLTSFVGATTYMRSRMYRKTSNNNKEKKREYSSKEFVEKHYANFFNRLGNDKLKQAANQGFIIGINLSRGVTGEELYVADNQLALLLEDNKLLTSQEIADARNKKAQKQQENTVTEHRRTLFSYLDDIEKRYNSLFPNSTYNYMGDLRQTIMDRFNKLIEDGKSNTELQNYLSVVKEIRDSIKSAPKDNVLGIMNAKAEEIQNRRSYVSI